MNFRASGHLTGDDLYQVIRFKEIARYFRVFAIPKTIFTKAGAEAMGEWLGAELKNGSDRYGGLLKGKLPNESELLGTTTEWTDWLSDHARIPAGVTRDTHFYRRCCYMDSLVALIFPEFEVGKLLAPPTHRARGKKYVRK
jgi:hypothetical protein